MDFHFRGEQDIFEAEYEHLIPKALSLLGEELYSDLSKQVGEPVKDRLYEDLFAIYHKVDAWAVEHLSVHEIQLPKYV